MGVVDVYSWGRSILRFRSVVKRAYTKCINFIKARFNVVTLSLLKAKNTDCEKLSSNRVDKYQY